MCRVGRYTLHTHTPLTKFARCQHHMLSMSHCRCDRLTVTASCHDACELSSALYMLRHIVRVCGKLTPSPLSWHSMGSSDPEHTDTTSFVTGFLSRNFQADIFGFTEINERPGSGYFSLLGICNSRRSRFFGLTRREG